MEADTQNRPQQMPANAPQTEGSTIDTFEEEMDLGGRPTKYDPIFIDKVDEYLATTGTTANHLPKIESFCLFINIGKTTVKNWAKKYPRFRTALAKIMTKQAEQLMDDGIYGGKEINASIVKLILQNNHGMKERTDQTTNDKDLPAPIYNGKSTA